MIHCIWTPGAASSAHVSLTGVGYYRFGSGCPDIHLLASGGSVGLLLANGAVNKADRAAQLGTLTGTFQVILNGAMVIDEYVSIPDGTAIAWSQPGPSFSLKKPVVDWLLRDWVTPKPFNKSDDFFNFFWNLDPHFGGKAGYDLPEPDQAGSPRLTEYMWAGATGAAFIQACSEPVPPIYRAAAFDWVRLQYRRPYCYYDQDTGEVYRWSAEADTWVDEMGLRKSGKATVERPSLCTYQAADPEHLTIDREWAAAVLWNDPLAWRLLDHQAEAICSWPMCREPVLHGNLRAYGRTIKALALLVGAWGQKRPQVITALSNAFGGLATFPENPSPPKAISTTFTHVCATPADQAAHPDWDLATLCQNFRAVIVPWIGTALTAIHLGQSIPVPAGSLWGSAALDVLKTLRGCLMGPGRDVGGIDNDGLPAIPVPFHDSYAWKVPHRVKRANLQWNGTVTEWTACAVAALAKEGNAEAKSIATAMKNICPDLQGITLQGVEAYWPLLAL